MIDRLRTDKALHLSRVAEEGGEAARCLATSKARIGNPSGWGLIGPVGVLPLRHRQRIGSVLLSEAIRWLRETCKGAAFAGDPGSFGRVGFRAFPGV